MSKVNDEVRVAFLTKVMDMLTAAGEEVIRTNSGECAIPTLDSEGNEIYVVFTVKVPTGTHDGDAYDAYAAADEYQMKVAKAQERARKTAEKAAKAAAKKKKA